MITVGSIIFLYLFIRSYSGVDPYPVKIKTVSSRDSDVMSYIVSYLLPFLGISFKDVLSALSFGISITVIGIIYVSANMVYINPVFSLRGYHMLEVEDDAGKVSPLISRGSYVSPGSIVNVVPLGDFALLEKEKKQ
jgi:hypothetical protein